MLRIHADQMEWFAKKAQRDFVARMSGYLREHYADLITPIPDLGAWIMRVIERSFRAKVTTEPEIAQLMLFFLILEGAPEQMPSWVDPILQDRDLHPVGKARLLVAEARRREVPLVDEIDITDTLEA